MDSLTTQLLSFIPTNTEDFQKLEIEIQKLIKERDSIQQTLQSEYPSSIISGSNAPAPNPSGSNLDTVLRREHKVTSNDDSRASTDSIANQLGALKVAERRLLVATHSLAVKRARAAMANPDGPNMKIKSMLEAKILEHQAFLEARMKSAQLSAERHALKLQSPIAQVHLPPSDDPRWSVVSISTEVPNATSEDPATGFGLWTGWAKSSVCSVGAVKLDISFRVSIVKADRGDWFKPEFMNHSSQYMRLPGGERWSEWPCNVQTPEQMVERIILGEIEPKGCLPTLPVGYLVAKDILIKVPTSEQPGSISKQDLVKQAAIANGILGFSFAPQASAHGNSGALHINEYSDGIVFRLPDAQILGYLMELTPPDHCADYDADLADSNLKILVDNDHHVETSRNTRADTCNCHCHRSS
ncbi:hypothetical protein B0J17DRAFT_136914 [Rhizoctonia solani]|nr:hypothetical protein B0J17DRAFT_136914 [Rhizoctonia solani]